MQKKENEEWKVRFLRREWFYSLIKHAVYPSRWFLSVISAEGKCTDGLKVNEPWQDMVIFSPAQFGVVKNPMIPGENVSIFWNENGLKHLNIF